MIHLEPRIMEISLGLFNVPMGNGYRYSFSSLIEGVYQLKVVTPLEFVPTKPNTGDQIFGGVLDSDFMPDTRGMDLLQVFETFKIGCIPCLPVGESGTGDGEINTQGGYPVGHIDNTHDAGFWKPCCSGKE